MGTVRVVLRKCRKLKDRRYPVVIRLTHNKKVKYIFTGYSALEREWNGKYPSYLNGKHPNQKELNLFLFQEYSKTNNQLLKIEQSGKPYTVYVEKPTNVLWEKGYSIQAEHERVRQWLVENDML